jgi:hypothetical protein
MMALGFRYYLIFSRGGNASTLEGNTKQDR